MREDKIQEVIDNAEWMMAPSTRTFWDKIKVKPQKWQLPPMEDMGGGFWVVAVVGQKCIYYNDIEEGFNLSSYEQVGHINDYWCNQSDLASFANSYCQDFIAAVSEE